jgi:hypothetical protein
MHRKTLSRVLIFLFLLATAPPARSQGGFTTVTGTITDPNGVKWSCGTISAQLITAGGAAPTLNGGGFTTQTSPVSLGCPTTPGSGANGSFAMRLADSGQISPSNTKWQFTVGTTGNAPPLGTGPQSFTFTTAINCSTNTPSTCTSNQLDISTQLSALAPALGGGGGSSSFPVTTPVTVNSGGSITETGTGHIGPSSLSQFFTHYYGLSPQDFGAKGDVHYFGNCGMTGGVATINCGTSHFTAADVGKQFEQMCPGGTPNPVRGTITSFNSGTSVGVSASCSVTTTNQATAYGTDDTAPLQAWVAAMITAAVNGVPPSARGGYLPQGGYWTQKALRFIYPGGQDSTTGECAPGPGSAGNNIQLRCSLWLAGDGTDNSYVYAPSDFNWGFPSRAVDNAVVFINHWDFSLIGNFAIQAPMSNAQWDTTTNTGAVAVLMFEDNSHQSVSNMYVAGGSNTTTTMAGVAVPSDFESTYSFSAVETNNVNWKWNPLENAVSTGAFTSGNFEKEYMDSIFLENPSATAFGNMMIGQNSTLKQFRMHNIHFRSDAGSTVIINVRSSVAIPAGDSFICDQCRVTDVLGTGHLGFVIQSAGRYVFHELNYINSNSVATSANAVAFTLQAAAQVGLSGGEINITGATNAINLSSGSPTVYAVDVTATSPSSIPAFSRGTGTVNGLIRTPTGWGGTGGVAGTYFLSNQGTAAASGNFALSAGWGTTAAVTATAGFNQSARFTVTASGTGQAANPTITWTLPTALPAATSTCQVSQTGGTNAFLMITQTTLSATAPVFTLQGTPTAAATFIYDVRCGP